MLRDDVEFAEPRLSASSDDDAPAAAELSWLALDFGLCVLDQGADRRIELLCDRSAVAPPLLELQWDGTSEILSIDRYGSDTRDRARRRLLLRRALFASDREGATASRVIPADAAPTLAAMLRATASLEGVLFSALIDVLGAGLPLAELRSTLAGSSIDLTSLLDAAERASKLDERRPVVGAHELERLRQA